MPHRLEIARHALDQYAGRCRVLALHAPEDGGETFMTLWIEVRNFLAMAVEALGTAHAQWASMRTRLRYHHVTGDLSRPAMFGEAAGVLHEMGSTLQVDDLRFDWRGVLPGGALDEPVDR